MESVVRTASTRYGRREMPTRTTTAPKNDLGFDALLGQLREVVGKLETGGLSLEESLRAYEAGVILARKGHSLLDQAEKRIEVLSENGKKTAFEDLDDGTTVAAAENDDENDDM
jgi:exodeoxyribonuclease VII small subunit